MKKISVMYLLCEMYYVKVYLLKKRRRRKPKNRIKRQKTGTYGHISPFRVRNFREPLAVAVLTQLGYARIQSFPSHLR